jgi:PEGA domain
MIEQPPHTFPPAVPRRRDLRSVRLVLALSLIVCLALGSRAAIAGPGIVAVVGTGKTPDLKLFSLVAEAAAKAAGWTLTGDALDGRATREATACMERDRPVPCLAAIMSPRGADRFLFIEVGASPEDAAVLQITASVVLSESGTPSVAERFCKSCDEAALRSAVNDLARSLIQTASAASGRTVVTVTATPAGAWIYLDGNLVISSAISNSTRARVATYPGPHTVTVENAGYETQILKITATEGKPTEITVDLKSASPGSGAPPPSAHVGPPKPAAWRTPVGWGLAGAGAATAILGVVLIALDEDQPPLGVQRSAEYFDSATFGTGLVIGGVAALGVGGYLLLTRPHSKVPTTRPTVTLLPGGGALGWEGAF